MYVFNGNTTSNSFKPYYNWPAFNTNWQEKYVIIVGDMSFKPCYNWNTFNTKISEIWDISELNSFKPCYKWTL